MATDRLDAIEAEVKHHEDPVVSTREIVDAIDDDVSRRTVLDDLRLLERADAVESKQTGAHAVAWWHVDRVTPAPPRSPADHPDQADLEDVAGDEDRDVQEGEPDEVDRVDGEELNRLGEMFADALDGWRPGRDLSEQAERREIGRKALDWLRDQEEDVRRQDVVAALYEATSVDGQGEDAWWRRTVRPAFKNALEQGYVENPGRRWRWVAVDDDRAEPVETDGGAAANLPDVSDDLEPLLADVADELDHDDVQALAALLETAAHRSGGSTRLFDDMDNTTGDVDGVTLSLSEASDGRVWVDAVDGGTVHSLGTLDDR